MITFKDYLQESNKASYKIEKGYASHYKTGREVAVYHVKDAKDGYIHDTFDLRRDAKEWIERATKRTEQK